MKYHSKHLGCDIAGKEDAVRLAANPAAAEMIEHLDEAGVETLFDRFEAQNPQCGFGLRGLCCSMCQWGPCRISASSPRGVCGRGMELVVMANLLRSAAAGTSAQTMHAHEMILTLLSAARGEITLSLQGKKRLREVALGLNVGMPWTPIEQIAEGVAGVMLDDLGRLTEGELRCLKAFSPKERQAYWRQRDLIPRSAAFEVLEAMHMTTLGACSDWTAIFAQALRTSLACAYSGLVTSSVVSDILFGIPEPRVDEVNYGILKADHVNVLVHGHSPVMLEKVLEKIESPEIQKMAEEAGAAGIVVGGMCCTGHEALARHGVPAVTGSMGQELVLGTGAVDALVVDMQCVLPGIRDVADCFGTEIVTTCRSNRIPGATHVPFDPEHPESLDEDALLVARLAIEAFSARDRTKIHIPAHTSRVMTGFSRESVLNAFGGVRKMLPKIENGEIAGITAMVGCSTPKAGYETSHVTIARDLIAHDVLVLTSGCSAHAMLNAGLCSPEAARLAGPRLREACEAAGIPPVLVVGSCSDNTRILQVFAALAHEADLPLHEMPFVLSGPELANEKTIAQTLAVLAHGVSAVVGITPRLPIPALGPTIEQAEAGSSANRNSIVDFFCNDGLPALVGSRLLVEPDANRAAELIAGIVLQKRADLGWQETQEEVAVS